MTKATLQLISGCVLLFAATLLTACQSVKYQDKARSVDLATSVSGETAVEILASASEWRNTGVRLRAGTTYKVRSSGRWQAAGTCDPTGGNGDGMYGLLCPGWELGRIIKGTPHQTLIAKIGLTGTPFAVSSYSEFAAPQNGILYLRMNEEDAGVGDNTGSLKAMISLLDGPTKAAKIAAPTTAPRSTQTVNPVASGFPTTPISISFKPAASRPDDIAVIIGNADYTKQGQDIPNVQPAYADAAAMRNYVVQALGVREGNIIDLRDATSAKLVEVFGSVTDPRGQLFDWVRPNQSRVFIYYAGHGAPAEDDGSPLLVPVDANATRIKLSGYSLETLYRNLSKVPARSITVVLEACFSGASQGGTVISKASPIYLKPKTPPVPSKVTVIAAGSASQLASWEKDGNHGLFTKHFLLGMSGEADRGQYGNNDGQVDYQELDRYLKGTMTYLARRYYGRDQTARIVVGKNR